MIHTKNILLLLALLLVSYSCGLPDASTVALDLNQPFILDIKPGDSSISIIFQAQNNEPSFSGYNIYFGDRVDPRIYKIYSPQSELPTISALHSDIPVTHEFVIKEELYASTNNSEIFQLKQNDIANGVPIYVWISSYQIAPERESSYVYDYYVQTATPRPEVSNQTVVDGDNNITIDGNNLASVTTVGGILHFANVPNGQMQLRVANTLGAVSVPPLEGYSTDSIPIIADRAYLIRVAAGANFRYGKIFVKSVTATSAVIDYAFQTSENILSY